MLIPRLVVLMLIGSLVLPLVARPSVADAAQPTWTHQGPTGEIVETLTVHPRSPDTIFVGTRYGGTYKSVDAGRTWTPTGARPNGSILILAVDPDQVEVA